MKKYFLSIVALAGMLFATSCQESLVEPQVGGTTTFTVQVPDQMGTKANGDSYKLFVEVYSADGSESYHRIEAQDMAVGTATTVTLNLVANQEYDIIFWAQKNAESYGVDDLRTVQMNASHHNSETGAAFYAVLDNYNPTQGKKDVELTRPFAQLNFYTNNNVSYGSVQVLRSTINVTNVATSFNRVADKTYGEGVTTGTYTYTSRDAENTNRDLPVGDPKNIDGVSYQYVSMDYLAVPGNEALVDIEATFFVKDSKDVESEIKRTFEGIPVQMNYRTNIIGNLITSASDFKVEISEVWGGDDNNVVKTEVSTAAELKAAIENTVGGEIVLTDGIELTESLVFGMSAGTKSGETAESDYVLDLNGRTITGTMPKSVGAVIKNNGILTIKNGTISSTAANGGSAISNYGTLNVMNATINGASKRENESWPSYPVNNYSDATFENVLVNGYQGAIACNAAGTTTLTECTINKEYLNTSSHVFYISHVDAEVVVNSGTYTHKGMDGSLAYNMGKITVNGGTFSASNGGYGMASLSGGSIEVNGGDFSAAFQGWGGTINITGGTFASRPKEDFIADGYKAVEKDGKFYVVEGDVDIVITNPDQLTSDVIKECSNIYLAAPGEYYANLYDIDYKETLTITGTEGVKFAHTADKYGQLRIEQIQNFTIRNCEILKRVVGDKNWGMMVFSTGRPNGVYTIENCTFNGVETQGIYINEKNSSAVYHIKNCTFNGDFGTEGAITISTHQGVEHTVNVTGCEFNNIPADSHRIFLTKSTAIFYDFTLNTDLKATTAYELEMFLALGQENVVVANDITIGKINLTNRNKNVIIDCNNKTITTTAEYGVEINAGQWSKVELKNANIKMTRNGDYLIYAAGFKINNGDYTGKTIKLDNCTITMANTDWAYAINMPASVMNLNLDVNECGLTGAIALQCWGDNNIINISNSELICNYTTSALYTSYCLAFQNDGTYTAQGNTLNVKESKFDYIGVDNFNSEIKSIYNGHSSNTISVSDCIYEGGVIE